MQKGSGIKKVIICGIFRPMIEMVIPSSLDPTLAPDKCHVCLLFTQYTPYNLSGKKWDNETKDEYLNIGKYDRLEKINKTAYII